MLFRSLLTGTCPAQVEVEGPTGRRFVLDVLPLPDGECGVVKDAGDDIDATDGMTVCAAVALEDGDGPIDTCLGS